MPLFDANLNFQRLLAWILTFFTVSKPTDRPTLNWTVNVCFWGLYTFLPWGDISRPCYQNQNWITHPRAISWFIILDNIFLQFTEKEKSLAPLSTEWKKGEENNNNNSKWVVKFCGRFAGLWSMTKQSISEAAQASRNPLQLDLVRKTQSSGLGFKKERFLLFGVGIGTDCYSFFSRIIARAR